MKKLHRILVATPDGVVVQVERSCVESDDPLRVGELGKYRVWEHLKEGEKDEFIEAFRKTTTQEGQPIMLKVNRRQVDSEEGEAEMTDWMYRVHNAITQRVVILVAEFYYGRI